MTDIRLQMIDAYQATVAVITPGSSNDLSDSAVMHLLGLIEQCDSEAPGLQQEVQQQLFSSEPGISEDFSGILAVLSGPLNYQPMTVALATLRGLFTIHKLYFGYGISQPLYAGIMERTRYLVMP